MIYRVLAINPGSTSTKISVFDDETHVFTKTLRHDPDELDRFSGVIEQFEFRKNLVLDALRENNVDPATLEAVVGRGGLVRAVAGGTYRVNSAMLQDLQDPTRWGRIHASNLGAFIADSIAQVYKIPAFIVDPVTVDEFDDIARVSGIPQIERKSLFHALNIRYTARLLARQIGKEFADTNQIAVHMGGGITVAAIRKGRTIDTNNALLGMGPFSPQRAGALPIGDLLDLAFSGNYTKKQLTDLLSKKAGYIAYLGTDSGIEVAKRIAEGDEKAKFIQDALCYQIAKEVGGYAAALCGQVDAIFLTGGLSYNEQLTGEIARRVKFIAPVHVLPGEKEMEALCQGGARVLKNLEPAREY
jgi:butyrate kinase